MNNFRSNLINWRRLGAFAVAFFALHLWFNVSSVRSAETSALDEQKSVYAFSYVASVLQHPRCLNCHTPGNSPLQGDEERHHTMNVKRAQDGRGTVAMRCTNCHQEANSAFFHGPPGAADWHLPPAATPMAWKGLSTGDLCRTLKDPGKNGNRNLNDLVIHMDTSLVKWAWDPGPGRSIPPLSHEQFVGKLQEWINTGAACAP